jgi:hypothetical protein
MATRGEIMNIKHLKSIVIAIAVLAVLGGAYAVRVRDMTGAQQGTTFIRERLPYSNEAERQSWIERNRHFAQSWLARHERNVTSEIIPFLDDPDEKLRERAAKALGRLEDPGGEAPLQKKLEQVEKISTAGGYREIHGVPAYVLRLALGRIRAHNLKGREKLDKIAADVGLTYDKVLELTQQLETSLKSKRPLERQKAERSLANEISLEFVDILYTMGKQGENIEALESERMAVGPAIEMKLKGATLPLDQEIEVILDYATQPHGGAFDESYLVELGPRATEKIIERLKEIHRDPRKYNCYAPGAVGHAHFFRAAAMTNDRRMIPYLKQIEEDFKEDYLREEQRRDKMDRWSMASQIYNFARDARQDIERQSAFPIVPAY